MNKTVLNIKATEARSPSPIPEDLIGEEIREQSTSSATFDQEKKVEEKENVQEQQRKKDEEVKEEETVKDENKRQETESAQGNNSDNTGQKISETDKEIDAESETKETKPEVLPIQAETKLRGKSKATGRIMGGWI